MAGLVPSLHAIICTVRFATLEMKLGFLAEALARRYRPDQPRAPKGTREGGQWISELSTSPERERVRVAGPRCDGFSGGCQMGGTFGTTGMYEISGKKFCKACALKFLGIQELPRKEQEDTLRGFEGGTSR